MYSYLPQESSEIIDGPTSVDLCDEGLLNSIKSPEKSGRIGSIEDLEESDHRMSAEFVV